MISEILGQWCVENSVSVSSLQKSSFEQYAELLVDWNKKMNLTAITESSEIATKHFIDSIAVLKYADIKENASIIDIGTGAGFPGIPIKIMRSDINLTLLDSLNKRLLFLKEVCARLNINAELIHSRAEESSLKPEYREKFDVAASRAVANLPALCEYCIPYVKVGGIFIAMKGSDADSEIKSAENAVKLLGGYIERVERFTLPDRSERTIITIRKKNSSPQKYPRRSTKINKSPL